MRAAPAYKIFWLYQPHCLAARSVTEATREGREVWVCRHDTDEVSGEFKPPSTPDYPGALTRLIRRLVANHL